VQEEAIKYHSNSTFLYKGKGKTKRIKYKQPKCGLFKITTFQTTKLKFSEVSHYLLYRAWTGAGYTYT